MTSGRVCAWRSGSKNDILGKRASSPGNGGIHDFSSDPGVEKVCNGTQHPLVESDEGNGTSQTQPATPGWSYTPGTTTSPPTDSDAWQINGSVPLEVSHRNVTIAPDDPTLDSSVDDTHTDPIGFLSTTDADAYNQWYAPNSLPFFGYSPPVSSAPTPAPFQFSASNSYLGQVTNTGGGVAYTSFDDFEFEPYQPSPVYNSGIPTATWSVQPTLPEEAINPHAFSFQAVGSAAVSPVLNSYAYDTSRNDPVDEGDRYSSQ